VSNTADSAQYLCLFVILIISHHISSPVQNTEPETTCGGVIHNSY